MTVAVTSQRRVPAARRFTDLPRQAQFVLLTLRLARELSLDDRNFQCFVYSLCGISRVERALAAIGQVLWCLNRAPRSLLIEATETETVAEDERRLLALLRCRRELGLARAGQMVPRPLDETLLLSLNRLADTLE